MSDVITLARPYAKAAFAVARDAGALGPWSAALELAVAAAENDTVQRLIADPNVDNEGLVDLFLPADGGPEGFSNLVNVLVHYDRLPVLPEIARIFDKLKADAEQTMAVTVRSATELSADYQSQLSASLSKRLGRSIELACEVDPTVLGGAVIQAGDMIIDGSLRRRLGLMAESLKG